MTLPAQIETGSTLAKSQHACLLEFRNIRIVYDNANREQSETTVTISRDTGGTSPEGKGDFHEPATGSSSTKCGTLGDLAVRHLHPPAFHRIKLGRDAD